VEGQRDYVGGRGASGESGVPLRRKKKASTYFLRSRRTKDGNRRRGGRNDDLVKKKSGGHALRGCITFQLCGKSRRSGRDVFADVPEGQGAERKEGAKVIERKRGDALTYDGLWGDKGGVRSGRFWKEGRSTLRGKKKGRLENVFFFRRGGLAEGGRRPEVKRKNSRGKEVMRTWASLSGHPLTSRRA